MTSSQTTDPVTGARVVDRWLNAACVAPACWSAAACGLHLWPVEGRAALEPFAPSNVGVLAWAALLPITMVSRTFRARLAESLPGSAILSLAAVTVASVGVATAPGVAARSAGKMILMYVAAFTMYRTAAGTPRGLRLLMTGAVVAAALAAAGALIGRAFGLPLGFADNRYKYGSLVALLTPPATVWLSGAGSRRGVGAGLVLLASGAVAASTLGAVVAVVVATAVGFWIVGRTSSARPALAGAAAAVAVGAVAASWIATAGRPLRDDLLLGETDTPDVRQRYVEQQAYLNLLESRPAIGTGVGCVNDHRSAFYGRLPKLNTLEPYDRNGWLLTAAELGGLGLTAFVWVVISAMRSAAWTARRSRSAMARRTGAAALAGLIAACIANTFSSVSYNGVVNAFVLVLAMAHANDRKEALS